MIFAENIIRIIKWSQTSDSIFISYVKIKNAR